MVRILLTLALLFLAESALASGFRDSLDLGKVKTIRVLLYDQQPTSNLKLGAKDGAIRLFDGKRFLEELQPGDVGIVVLQHGVLTLTTPRRNYTIRASLEIQNTADSFIQTIHPQVEYRYFKGDISIDLHRNKRQLHVMNQVQLEDYVASVVGSEMNFEEPEALKTQAVIARTYVLWNLRNVSNREFDVTDHTLSQVYLGELINKPHFRSAAEATAGEVVTWSEGIILAAFFSTCGGATTNNELVWKGRALPYLRTVNDHEMCRESPHFAWEFKLDKRRLLTELSRLHRKTIHDFDSLHFDRGGRLHRLSFRSQQGHFSLQGNEFRLNVMKVWGSKSLKSTKFELQDDKNMLTFKGKGMGHGIGLCQWGTLGFARAGWNYQDILKFYYTGVEIVNIHQLQRTHLPLAN